MNLEWEEAYDEMLYEQEVNNIIEGCLLEADIEEEDDDEVGSDLFDFYTNADYDNEEEFFQDLAGDLFDELEDDLEDELKEAKLNIAARRKKSRLFRRLANSGKLKRAKDRALRKAKSHKVWMKKARKAVLRHWKNILLQKRFGKTIQTAKMMHKQKVEDILKKPKWIARFKPLIRKKAKELKHREAELKKGKSSSEAKANALLPKSGDASNNKEIDPSK